ncbi:hypothetical protein P4H94_07435 [Paenibacillus macerans]|uniref:Uncharacterized protein n=1 Tax=Paenibacillus macerans TaxID=44252 RepID=A0A6N8ESS1_PAEMA|nr:hypothetical protein [Paenibacillus macerans]MEC0136717.1 hypothetical protein [Paenibacillus macerans]MED4955992.1 hypothetical protein [Paenibacillus macerans]MUG21793.1 hypothetical protein [Paenibacillus macerans]
MSQQDQRLEKVQRSARSLPQSFFIFKTGKGKGKGEGIRGGKLRQDKDLRLWLGAFFDLSPGLSQHFSQAESLIPHTFSQPFWTLIFIPFRSQLNQFLSSFSPLKPDMKGQ